MFRLYDAHGRAYFMGLPARQLWKEGFGSSNRWSHDAVSEAKQGLLLDMPVRQG